MKDLASTFAHIKTNQTPKNMKKFVQLSLMTFSLLLSVSMMAKDNDFSISFGEVKANAVHFEVANSRNVSLTIYSARQKELYSEKVDKEDKVSRAFSFNDMAAGTYYLVAESDAKIEKYEITISSKGVIIDQTPVSKIAKPEYTIDGNRVRMAVNDTAGKPVKVSVYDAANNLEFAQTKEQKEGNVVMNFDFNKNNSPFYVISVEKDGDTFNKVIAFK